MFFLYLRVGGKREMNDHCKTLELKSPSYINISVQNQLSLIKARHKYQEHTVSTHQLELKSL